jgi:hypothetical protein
VDNPIGRTLQFCTLPKSLDAGCRRTRQLCSNLRQSRGGTQPSFIGARPASEPRIVDSLKSATSRVPVSLDGQLNELRVNRQVRGCLDVICEASPCLKK